MMTKTFFATFLAATAMTGAASAAELMRCSHQLPPGHHISEVIEKWAAEVETLSNGEIDVQIFGADSLIKANDNILAVARGEIECAFSLNFQWGKMLPLMNVTIGPYTMSSIESWKKWPDSEAAAYLEGKLLDKGVKNIAWMFQTNVSVFTSKGKALTKPDDFKGLKMRGLGPAFDRGLTAMGASTVSLPGSEVYQALATGVIDAAVTDVAAAYSHGYVTPSWYDGLTGTQKAAIDEAGRKAAGWAIEASEKASADAPAQLQEKGVTVHIATSEENEAFRAAMQPAFEEGFAAETGEEGRELLALIAKIK